MNKTKIEWCDMTWNPVTGCLHGCNYCYAQGNAKRFGGRWNQNTGGNIVKDDGKLHEIGTPLLYERKNGDLCNAPFPYVFSPTLYKYRLDELSKIKTPQNIFVCSMADLFGEWVPEEWIRRVFEECLENPQHRYLFLTKNPKRYEQFIDEPMSNNMWFGFSQTKNEHVGFDTHPSWNVFVSIEPLLCDLSEKASPEGIDWVIIGAETGNRKGKVKPKREWIESIVADCRSFKVPVFMKSSLAEIWQEPLVQEYPWGK